MQKLDQGMLYSCKVASDSNPSATAVRVVQRRRHDCQWAEIGAANFLALSKSSLGSLLATTRRLEQT